MLHCKAEKGDAAAAALTDDKAADGIVSYHLR